MCDSMECMGCMDTCREGLCGHCVAPRLCCGGTLVQKASKGSRTDPSDERRGSIPNSRTFRADVLARHGTPGARLKEAGEQF